MNLISFFLDTIKVANKVANARGQAGVDLAKRHIDAHCDEGRKRDSVSVRATGEAPAGRIGRAVSA